MFKKYQPSYFFFGNKKFRNLIIFILLAGMTFLTVMSQSPRYYFELSGNESGETKTYTAKNYITLLPGFTYTATPQYSFWARIDTNIVVIDTTNMNPTGNSLFGDSLTTAVITSSGNTYTSSNPSTPPTGIFNNYYLQVEENSIKQNTSYLFPIIWFKTTPTSTDVQNGFYAWRDYSGNNVRLRKYDSRGAAYGEEYIVHSSAIKTYNFNPALNISLDQISKEIFNAKSNLAQTTIMGIWGPNEENIAPTDNFVFAVNGRQAESILFSKNKVVESVSSGKSDIEYGNGQTKNLLFQPELNVENTENKFKEQSLRIATYCRANKPNNSLWGEEHKSVISLGSNYNNSNVNNVSTQTFDYAFNNYSGYKGYTPELLVFDKILTPKETTIFQTYLALKYGLSLDTTYIAPDGNIMWNCNENTSYNNRIAGYARQDALGLYQTTTTTSYEESPYFSYQNSNESYDNSDFYKMSSRKKLLVVGKEPANPINNGDYVIFGDNTESLTIPTNSNNIPNYRAIPRRWLLKTNIQQTNVPQSLLWSSSSNLEISESNYKLQIHKPSSSASASAVTENPLVGKDGYFAWTVNDLSGSTMVKFGQKNASLTENGYDYGYILKNNGKLYKIEHGIESMEYFKTIVAGQKLEIEKTGNLVYLRINGTRIKESECFITKASDIKANYYGTISIQNTNDVTISNFRHGGFVNTGDRVELSYYSNRASDFATDKENVYLIVDKSGTGNFNDQDVESYLVSEVDATRSKLIFNNVYWDTDGNRKDVFTFGYFHTASQNIKKEQDTPVDELGKENYANVYYKDIKDMSLITVKVYISQGDSYTLSVHDVSGRSIYKKDCLGSKEEQFTDIRLPYPGFYIVKILSKSYQHSTKVISN